MKNKLLNVNSGRSTAQFDIAKVEEKYKAKFVGQFPLKTKFGNWQEDSCADIYYQETPPVAGYSHYFALFTQLNGSIYITTGAQAVEGTFTGSVADDGEIIYSRYTHDYRTSTDGTTWVDGGRDYIRSGNTSKLIQFEIIDGEFYEVTESKE